MGMKLFTRGRKSKGSPSTVPADSRSGLLGGLSGSATPAGGGGNVKSQVGQIVAAMADVLRLALLWTGGPTPLLHRLVSKELSPRQRSLCSLLRHRQ